MIKFIFIKIALLQLCIPLTYSFQVTFRKNITLDPNDFFVVTHDYIKDLTYTTNDYIDNVKTQYTVTLVNFFFIFTYIFLTGCLPLILDLSI